MADLIENTQTYEIYPVLLAICTVATLQLAIWHLITKPNIGTQEKPIKQRDGKQNISCNNASNS
jgi:hypothetical protein